MAWIRETVDGVILSLLIQPRASKNEVVGPQGENLKLRLTAPPVDGAANKLCVTFLAKCLGVPKSALEIIAGQSSRHKQILIRSGGGLDEIRTALERVSK